MTDTFDWEALRAEMAKHPIRSTYYVTIPPSHPPERIITGCTDGIEPIRLPFGYDGLCPEVLHVKS